MMTSSLRSFTTNDVADENTLLIQFEVVLDVYFRLDFESQVEKNYWLTVNSIDYSGIKPEMSQISDFSTETKSTMIELSFFF